MLVIMLAVAYLLGSIPTAIIAGRLLTGIDIRTRGSGNAGATNAARILGLRTGLIVALVDLAKGLAAVLLVSRIAELPGSAGPVLCGIAAIGGHIFSVFAGFRGGKGVATSAGAAIALFPILAPFCLACFLLVAALSRWVALASMAAAFSLPALYLIWCAFGGGLDPWRIVFSMAVFLIVSVAHRGNIARLFRGEERKIDIKGMLRRRSGEAHE